MRALHTLAALFAAGGFGLDFAWLDEATGGRLRDLAGGALAVGLIVCGIASTLGSVAVLAARAGLPVGDKGSSFASGAVVAGIVGAVVLATVAGAMRYYAGITVGW